ncbi:MAG: hypothetical protein AAF196_02875 [Planctomycetota bacterium]
MTELSNYQHRYVANVRNAITLARLDSRPWPLILELQELLERAREGFTGAEQAYRKLTADAKLLVDSPSASPRR